ncbi:DUF6478 family protein [Pontivivens ytuae]|uniref:Uncharacterized protein n=1 Tax=Pontivivens ytuae TaxID=2789856 RepID=A0A7S9LPJ7_9RHOB|nr:DUF6478 family protein [Pontivivens ytuae]QPH52952.1 hypothetical protein I0K15_14200 [Pontivivens ytuae]
MLARLTGLWGVILTRLTAGLWTRRLTRAEGVEAKVLRRWRAQSRRLLRLTRTLDELATRRLNGPVSTSAVIEVPPDATMVFRPALLATAQEPAGHAGPASNTAVAPGVTLFHDMPRADALIRQRPGPDGRHACEIELWGGGGSFLSLALALPEAEAQATRREDLIRLAYDIGAEHPTEIFARLNLSHGPNVEEVVRQVDLRAGTNWLEFDVFYTDFEPERVNEIWIDLMFDPRTANRITLRDILILRRPRLSL